MSPIKTAVEELKNSIEAAAHCEAIVSAASFELTVTPEPANVITPVPMFTKSTLSPALNVALGAVRVNVPSAVMVSPLSPTARV